MAWGAIVVVGLVWRRGVLLWIRLFQMRRGVEAGAVGSRCWSAKKTENGGEAMARGHGGIAWEVDLV